MKIYWLALLSTVQALQIPFSTTTTASATNCGVQGDVFEFKSLVLNPDPPQKGHSLTFTVAGFLNEPIVQGAIVHVKVKLGFIGLLDQDMDLCEQIKNVGRACPLPEGPFELEHTVDIPGEAPSVSWYMSRQVLTRFQGKYSLQADAKNADSKHVACIHAEFRM